MKNFVIAMMIISLVTFVSIAFNMRSSIATLKVQEGYIAFAELHEAGVISPGKVITIKPGSIIQKAVEMSAHERLLGYNVYVHNKEEAVYRTFQCTADGQQYVITLKIEYLYIDDASPRFSNMCPAPISKRWFKLELEDAANLMHCNIRQIVEGVNHEGGISDVISEIQAKLFRTMEEMDAPLYITLPEYRKLVF